MKRMKINKLLLKFFLSKIFIFIYFHILIELFAYNINIIYLIKLIVYLFQIYYNL